MARLIDARHWTKLFGQLFKLDDEVSRGDDADSFSLDNESIRETFMQLYKHKFVTKEQIERYGTQILMRAGYIEEGEYLTSSDVEELLFNIKMTGKAKPTTPLSKEELASKIDTAIVFNELADLKKLLELEPEAVNWPNKQGDTPLQRASGGDKNFELVKLLLEHGADVNALGESMHHRYTAFHNAVRNGGLKTVQILLEYGADPTIPHFEVYGEDLIPMEKPIHVSESDNVIEYLVKVRGIDVRDKDHKGRTILDYLVEEYCRWNKKFPNFEYLRTIPLYSTRNYLEKCLIVVLPYFPSEEVEKAKEDFFNSYWGKVHTSLGIIYNVKTS